MNTTPSQRLGFLHHIRLVPLFACILGGILVLFALSSALAGYFLWQADRDQRDVTAEIEIRTGLANSSDFLRSQGPGFAVVASEVRTLASRSAQAAKEIEGLISESVRLIDLGADEVATAGKTMSTIVDAVASVTHIMQEIATASDEQSRGITQVSQAISEMDKVTQQNASLVEEASTAALSLEEQAARLTEAVDVFRLNKHSVSAEPRGAGEPVSFATV